MQKDLWPVPSIDSANLYELFADIKKVDFGALIDYCTSVCAMRKTETTSYEIDAVLERLKAEAVKIRADVESSAVRFRICWSLGCERQDTGTLRA